MLRKSSCLVLLVSLAISVPAKSVVSYQEDAIVDREFVYDDVPFPQCHASTLAETTDGLVCAWFGGTHEKHPDVGIWFARKTDDSWSDPVEVANGIQYVDSNGEAHRHPCWNPVLHQSDDGTLYLFYKCGPSPSTWWGMVTSSEDAGQTWTIPGRLPEGIDGPVRNKLIVLSDGTWLCGSSTEHDGWRVHFERTQDGGRSWQRIGPVENGDRMGAIQPTLLRHQDGSIQALCRDQDGRGNILSTHSTDDGISWSPLEAIRLPNPNSGIDAVTLDDGRHLLVYNHTHRGGSFPSGRQMLNVAVPNDGSDWSAVAVLELEDRAEFSYPAVIQTSDGMVHISYTWKRTRIRHVVIDPNRVEGQPIVDGAWPSPPQ